MNNEYQYVATGLQLMLDKQLELQKRLGALPEPNNEKAKAQFIKDNVVYIITELDELLREIPEFKPWKKYDNFDRELHAANANEEFVDVIHFVLNIALALGLSGNDIINLYMGKNKENHNRQDNNYGKDEK